MPTPNITISPTVEAFEIAAARAGCTIVMEAIDKRGRCMIALSGGCTPRGVYRRLGALLVTESVELSNTHIIFCDERMAPPDDASSNYGMARHEFISRIPIPVQNIHRVRGEETAEVAAYEYEQELKTIFPLFAGQCDLMILGVGRDGHTASLFPGTNVLHELQHTVRAVFVPHLSSWRVTLTFPVINSARAVLFLATGTEKAAIVAKILGSDISREDLPATLVHPQSGTITWMLEGEAAAQFVSESSSYSNSTTLHHAPLKDTAQTIRLTGKCDAEGEL
jgi:6-phosphogluconolactonase